MKDAVTEAMAGTETEIANSVFDTEDGDESTDRSLEDMGDGIEGDEIEGEDDAEEDDGAVEAKNDKSERDEKGQFKPTDGRTAALREERGKRQSIEAERDQYRTSFEALNAQIQNLNGQIQTLTRVAPRQQQQEVQARERPDPIVDPDGYAQYVRSEVEASIISRNVEETFRDAHEEHGTKFEAAYQALTSLDRNSPSDRALVQRISKSANPGRALMKWHERQEAVREIGDPKAYRERLRNELLDDPEFQQAVTARARERTGGNNQGGQRRPNNITRLPSLNSSGSGSGRMSRNASDDDDSDAAVAAYAFRD
jgi:hypothetical protein